MNIKSEIEIKEEEGAAYYDISQQEFQQKKFFYSNMYVKEEIEIKDEPVEECSETDELIEQISGLDESQSFSDNETTIASPQIIKSEEPKKKVSIINSKLKVLKKEFVLEEQIKNEVIKSENQIFPLNKSNAQRANKDFFGFEEVSELQENVKKEKPEQDLDLNHEFLVCKSLRLETVKAKKEIEDRQRKWLDISTSKYPKVFVKRLSTKDLKIYFEGVRNCNSLKILHQTNDQELEIPEGSYSGNESPGTYKNADINLRSEAKNCTKQPRRPGKFECRICNYIFKWRRNLKDHMLTHCDAKYFRCLECSYKTSWKGGLTKHMQKHRVTKLFRCSECSYECNKKSNLKYHLLTHTQIKLFKCSQCSYGSNDKNTLKRHMLRHTDIKLYKCAECSYACNEKPKLRRHMHRHTQAKIFKCSECSYSSNFKRGFNLHILKEHK